MTHTLHRIGTWEDLEGDFVFLMIPAKDKNVVGSAPKLKRFLEIALQHNPKNIGDGKMGNVFNQGSVDNILANVKDGTVCHAVFSTAEDAKGFLKDIVEEDLGLSVVVSGLATVVHEFCHNAGIERHSVEHSLGRMGRLDLLPPRKVLEITNMCGHSMVPAELVYKMVEDIRKGRRTLENAADELAKPCVCGIFNPARAARLLRAMASY